MTKKYELPTTWSKQAEDIFEQVVHGSGSLNVVARAGTGKSTVLLRVIQLIIEHNLGKGFAGMFNKSIAVEFQGKLEALGITYQQFSAGTMHSLGLGLWKRVAPDVKIEGDKVSKIIDSRCMRGDVVIDDFLKRNAASVRQAVSVAKQAGFGFLHSVDDEAEWFRLFDYYGINDFDTDADVGRAVKHAQAVLRVSLDQNREVIDFDDMVLAPLLSKAAVKWPYDWVLIDEAQDTNATRRALALKVLKPKTGRLIAVGDDRQAIYGFTGADADSMERIRESMGSQVLPLTITYRCPKGVVTEAQKYVPDIVAHESSPQGEVIRNAQFNPASGGWMIQVDSHSDKQFTFESTDAILCRNTAPLIELAYTLLGKKVACRVEGRDIGMGLQKLAQKWKVKDLAALQLKLEDYLDRERQKWLAKGREEKAGALEEKVASLLKLIEICQREGKHTVQDLVELISIMFSDSEYNPNSGRYGGSPVRSRVLTLSTVHKSKGKEWDRVFILDADKYMPSKYARKDWQKLQESNLSYVAITRAKQTLVWLSYEGVQQ